MKKLKYFGDRQAYNIKSVESLGIDLFPGFLNLQSHNLNTKTHLKVCNAKFTIKQDDMGLNIECLRRTEPNQQIFAFSTSLPGKN